MSASWMFARVDRAHCGARLDCPAGELFARPRSTASTMGPAIPRTYRLAVRAHDSGSELRPNINTNRMANSNTNTLAHSHSHSHQQHTYLPTDHDRCPAALVKRSRGRRNGAPAPTINLPRDARLARATIELVVAPGAAASDARESGRSRSSMIDVVKWPANAPLI